MTAPTTILTTAMFMAFAAACSTSGTQGNGGGATSSSSSSSSSTSTSTSSGGGLGGAGPVCVSSTERIPLSLLDGTECTTDAYGQPLSGVIEGTFTQSTGGSGGFVVSHGEETIEIGGVSPAIPTGTFVRIRYDCYGGHYGDAGAFVLIENVPTLDGAPNPTASDTRLWYFVAAGGEANIPPELPFTIEETAACGAASDNCSLGWSNPWSLRLSAPGASVVAKPTEEVPFSASSGDHAGAYTLHNVNARYVVYPGCDSTFERNFEIARAD